MKEGGLGEPIRAVKLNVLLQTKGSWMKGMRVWLLCYDWRALEQSIGLVGGSERGLVKLCVFSNTMLPRGRPGFL